MKRALLAGLVALTVAGCSQSADTSESSTMQKAPAVVETTTETATASGCTASGLDAMTALSDFQLEMDDAQKAGKLTVDQLTAARDKLFNQTQEAQGKEDWAAYCKSIDDMRTELGL
ncbi:hypothetical protein ACNQVK_10930 [Mycobacterium sp. 134]|uniref:hypothetical protein n=1 Tax=Mycobacterium sp. 134 TaxID=3400425 RepID=UPI003AAFFD1D